MTELDEEHQDFLGKYFKADTHYTKDEAPLAFIRYSKDHDVITDALNHSDPRIRVTAISNPNANKKHIDKALNDSSPGVRLIAIRHPNTTKEHIDKALNDTNNYNRGAAIEHPNTTKQHFFKAFKDVAYVQYKATETENYRKYFPNGHQ